MLIVDGTLGAAWNQIVIHSLCLQARRIQFYTFKRAQKQYNPLEEKTASNNSNANKSIISINSSISSNNNNKNHRLRLHMMLHATLLPIQLLHVCNFDLSFLFLTRFISLLRSPLILRFSSIFVHAQAHFKPKTRVISDVLNRKTTNHHWLKLYKL